jgi:DNA-binding NtrC family response regulator
MKKERESDKAEVRRKSEERYQEYWRAIRSPEMKKLKADIKRIAERIKEAKGKSLRILIYGESGAGKDYIADTFYHYLQPSGRIEKYDVGPITDEHAQSDLLGVEEGSYTKVKARPSIFEKCDHGLVFLDEIQNLLPIPQASLLTVINDSTVRRAGGSELIPVTFHLVVGTNVNLKERIKEGAFREDLYYRVGILELTVPPLRERKKDIEPLARMFFNSWVPDVETEIDDEVIEILEAYEYRKGNIRELYKIVAETSSYAENNRHITLRSLRMPKLGKDDKITDFTDGLEKCDIFIFYDRMKALNIQDMDEAHRLFGSWVRYHLENDPEKTLEDLERIDWGKNEHKLSFSKLKKVVRKNHTELKGVVDRFTFEVNASPPDEQDTEEKRKIDAYLNQDKYKQIVASMPVSQLMENVSRLLTESKISLSDLKQTGFLTSSKFQFQGSLQLSFSKYQTYIRELKHLIKNVAYKWSDNYGGGYYHFEKSEFIEKQLKRLLSDIALAGAKFQKQIEKNDQVLSSFDEEKFDPRVQTSINGTLTENFADFLIELKETLGISFYSFGVLLEVISGRYLQDVIKYRHLGKGISTSKAYLLKISSIRIGRRVGVEF